MSLLGPQTLSARTNFVGALGCCLNPCRKAYCLCDCDLAFINTVVLWGIGCRKFLPDFHCCAEAPKAPFETSPPPSLLTTSTLQGAEKYIAVSSLVRRKNTQVNRETSSLTIIMYSFSPVDFTDFGLDRSTKHRSAGLAVSV